MNENSIVAVAQRQACSPNGCGDSRRKVVESEAQGASFSAWQLEGAVDCSAKNLFLAPAENTVAIVELPRRIVGDIGEHRHIVSSFHQLPDNVVGLKLFWIEMLGNYKYLHEGKDWENAAMRALLWI